MVFKLLFVYIALCNGLKISEYETYWLMNFPLINNWATPRITVIFLSK